MLHQRAQGQRCLYSSWEVQVVKEHCGVIHTSSATAMTVNIIIFIQKQVQNMAHGNMYHSQECLLTEINPVENNEEKAIF